MNTILCAITSNKKIKIDNFRILKNIFSDELKCGKIDNCCFNKNYVLIGKDEYSNFASVISSTKAIHLKQLISMSHKVQCKHLKIVIKEYTKKKEDKLKEDKKVEILIWDNILATEKWEKIILKQIEILL